MTQLVSMVAMELFGVSDKQGGFVSFSATIDFQLIRQASTDLTFSPSLSQSSNYVYYSAHYLDSPFTWCRAGLASQPRLGIWPKWAVGRDRRDLGRNAIDGPYLRKRHDFRKKYS